MAKRVVSFLPWLAMGMLAFCLPFTSMPLVARLTGSTMVAPLSLLPMGAMLVFWLLPYLLRRGALPLPSKVLMAFVLIVLVSCIAAFMLPTPAYKGQTVLRQEIEALATLAVGLGFYLVISAWTNNPDRLCFVLRWINWGGMLMLGWSLAQAAVWRQFGYYPDSLWDFQGQISTSLMLFPQRVNGFAYEPSWLAHQLNMLYLPYWLAATVTGFTAHRFKLWKIHLENILLVGGVAVLFLSVSRTGWMSFLLMVAYLLLLLNMRFIRWVQRALLKRTGRLSRWEPVIRRWFVPVSLLVLLILFAGLVAGVGYAMTRVDPRMARLFDFSAIREFSFFYYANQLVFAERVVFWQAGWEVFNDFPILGVGLGNVGFFFPEKLNAFSWGLTETRIVVFHWTSMPNTKSLWVRLLAETGIIGFAGFLSWCYVLWKSGRFLLAQNDRLSKAIGIGGAFVLAALIVEGFGLDTFALPYYWVSFGLLAARTEMVRRLVSSGQPAG